MVIKSAKRYLELTPESPVGIVICPPVEDTEGGELSRSGKIQELIDDVLSSPVIWGYCFSKNNILMHKLMHPHFASKLNTLDHFEAVLKLNEKFVVSDVVNYIYIIDLDSFKEVPSVFEDLFKNPQRGTYTLFLTCKERKEFNGATYFTI